jgi:hypothetical protein
MEIVKPGDCEAMDFEKFDQNRKTDSSSEENQFDSCQDGFGHPSPYL